MDHARWDLVQSLFHRAADLPSSAQREFLRTECEGDEGIIEQVLEMLEQDAHAGSLLDRDLACAAYGVVGSGETIARAGQSFGPYRLLRILGEGGGGIVYLAMRDDLGSVAAIKILRDAWLSPARRERFVSEQRILSQLNHPSIARLYDADTLPDGTPWFVMEYVEGTPITDYCRDRGTSLAERLQLFLEICEAVQYSHGQLVVHRDLKPGNILITPAGGVKLLDFGIAKRLDIFNPMVTSLRLMTPAYAAPEQIRGGPTGVQTDVYALGAILYELLANRPPFDLSNRTPAEAERIIVDTEPTPVSLAAAEPMRRVAGTHAWADLDTLCLTAMHKDLQRRYGSVEALRRDVAHYLRWEPLEASPDSVAYRTDKFIRRNSRRLSVAAVIFATVVAVVIFYTARLASARNAAVAEANRTERIQRFMLHLFDGGDKAAGPADDLRVVALVDRGFAEARALDREPLVQAELYHTLGGIYRKLGKFERAETLLQSSLDLRRSKGNASAADVVNSLVGLALLRSDQARLDEAERLVREGLATARGNFRHTDPVVAKATAALGGILEQRGRYDQAIPVLEDAVRLQSTAGVDQAEQAPTLLELAGTHFYAGHYDVSESLNQQVLAMHLRLYGDRHPLVAESFINLGAIEHERGHYADAERFYRQALDINQTWYGKDSYEAASNLTVLGRSLVFQASYEEADDLLRKALAIQERVFGPVHPRVASALNDLGNVAMQRNQTDAAESHYRRIGLIYRSVYGDRHYLLGVAASNLAGVFMARKDYSTAEQMYREAVDRFTGSQSDDHLNTGIARIKLGRALLRQQRYAEAEHETLAGYNIVSKQAAPTVSWLKAAREDLVSIYEARHESKKADMMRAEAARVAQTLAVPPARIK